MYIAGRNQPTLASPRHLGRVPTLHTPIGLGSRPLGRLSGGGFLMALMLLSTPAGAQPSPSPPGAKTGVSATTTPSATSAVTAPVVTTPQALSVSATPTRPLTQIRTDAVGIRLLLDVDDPAAIADAFLGPLAHSPKKAALDTAMLNLAQAEDQVAQAVAKRDIIHREIAQLKSTGPPLTALKESAQEASDAVGEARKLVAKHKAELATIQPRGLVLLLDNVYVAGARPIGYAYADKKVWFEIPSFPPELQQGRTRDVSVSLDYTDLRAGAARGGVVRLVVINDRGKVWAWLWAALIFASVIVLGWRTNLLRDGFFMATPGQRKPWWRRILPEMIPADKPGAPFSLGRCQMAFWTVLVAWGWLYLWLASSQVVALSDSVLAMMGIATGTLLGAQIIDLGKASALRDVSAKIEAQTARLRRLSTPVAVTAGSATAPPALQAQAELPAVTAELASLNERRAQMVAPTKWSEGLLDDLLSDEAGISIHRLQMVLWTLVLGIFFIRTVVGTFGMPDMDGTLLALMGLSSGAYLGFKLPEKRTV